MCEQRWQRIQAETRSQVRGGQEGHHSTMWQNFLASKGAMHSLEDMLAMRQPGSSVTRGFGLDRRFSPSFDLYRNEPLYRDLLALPEPDFGSPEKIFPNEQGEWRSGIFLRNACYAFEIIQALGRGRDEAFTILEIGPGFGMLAYLLKHYFPKARLVLVDLSESMAICAWYLENTLPECTFHYGLEPEGHADVRFVAAEAFQTGMGRYDLAINCDSMSEMRADIAKGYLDMIESDIRPGGLLFFLNKEGVDQEALSRPTLYPFSPLWKVQSIQPTTVGFLDDYRHVQLCLRWSPDRSPSPPWRNPLLDAAYQAFSSKHLEYDTLFSALGQERICEASSSLLGPKPMEGWLLDGDPKLVMEVLPALLEQDPPFVSLIQSLVLGQGIEGLHVEVLEPHISGLVQAGSFHAVWTAARIRHQLGQEAQARDLWEQALELPNLASTLLLKGGWLLGEWGCPALAQRAMQRVLQESPHALERLEAARWLDLDRQAIDHLRTGLPGYLLAIGYGMVRLAAIYPANGCVEPVLELLEPLADGRMPSGQYELFAASRMLEALGETEQAKRLLEESIRQGHNDNGFYRKIGLFFEEKGDLASALDYLKQSSAMDVSWASTHRDLARIYEKLGQTDLERLALIRVLASSLSKDVDYTGVEARLKVLGY